MRLLLTAVLSMSLSFAGCDKKEAESDDTTCAETLEDMAAALTEDGAAVEGDCSSKKGGVNSGKQPGGNKGGKNGGGDGTVIADGGDLPPDDGDTGDDSADTVDGSDATGGDTGDTDASDSGDGDSDSTDGTVNDLPGQPSGLTLNVKSSSRIVVSWAAGANATGYRLAYSPHSEPASCSSGSVVDVSGTSKELTGLPYAFRYGFRVCSVNAVGVSTGITGLTPAGALGFDFESAAELDAMTLTGDANWSLTTSRSLGGTHSAQSGDIADSYWDGGDYHYSVSCMAVHVEFDQPTQLQFAWHVSSELGYDPLAFYVNDQVKDMMYGDLSSIALRSGFILNHYDLDANTAYDLKWCYEKDQSVSTGSDSGFLDSIRYAALMGSPHNGALNFTDIQEFSTTVNWEADLNADVIGGYRIAYAAWGSPGCNGSFSAFAAPDETAQTVGGLLGGQGYGFSVCSETADGMGVTKMVNGQMQTAPDTLTTNMGFDLGNLTAWDNPDFYGFVAQSDVVHDGSHAAASTNTDDYSYSCVTRNVDATEGDRTVTFWWKVSSESGKDRLVFHDNFSEIDEISGEVDWQQASFFLGDGLVHRLSWCYQKDDSGAAGDDVGYVDSVTVSP